MPLCIALLLFLPLQVPIMDIAKYTLNAMTIHQHYSVDQFAVEQGYKEGDWLNCLNRMHSCAYRICGQMT